MDKDKAKKKMEEIKENYEKITERIKELQEQKLRLEGQYLVYNEVINNKEESLKKEDE